MSTWQGRGRPTPGPADWLGAGACPGPTGAAKKVAYGGAPAPAATVKSRRGQGPQHHRGMENMDPYNTADSFGAGNTAARPPSASQPRNPYAAPRASVREMQAEGELVLASRLGRLGAVLIDSAIIGV